MERAGVSGVGSALLRAIRVRRRNEPDDVSFDITDYKRRAERLRWDDLDFASFTDRPLDDATLRCIEYMHDVELHTICYLRDLLVTPAHADPEVTAFLSCWAYEEMWHGSALVGERIVALHMTWGAVNEWTTQAGYLRLAQRAKHPVLTELTRRIARQEGRHIDFYVSEARRRL